MDDNRLTQLFGDESATQKSGYVIRAVDVRKVYKMGDTQTHALRGATLDVRRGEYLSIMGPSGSGKTTLFNIIGGLNKPTSGKVYIDQVDIAQLDPYELAWLRCRKVGYVFQSFNLIQVMSCLENVMLPMAFAGLSGDDAHDKALEILEMVGLADRALHKPSEMSGGQQQRVAVARALANSPEVILADEPTGNLDSRSGGAVADLLWRMNREKNIALVLVTHNTELAGRADRIMELKDGRLWPK